MGSLSVEALAAWFQALGARERRFVQFGAIAAALLLVFGVLLPLDSSVAHAHARLAHKEADLAWMQSVAPQLSAMSPASAAPTSQRSLIVIVDNAAREAGLGSALAGSEPSGQGGLRVRLDKAPFDTLVGWLARLADQNGIRVESATIDSAGAPGLVNAGIVLRGRH
jgi:general secretion pathway protein M